jgi:hypothetical protein
MYPQKYPLNYLTHSFLRACGRVSSQPLTPLARPFREKPFKFESGQNKPPYEGCPRSAAQDRKA